MDGLKLLFDFLKNDPSTYNIVISEFLYHTKARGEAIVHEEEFLKDPNLFSQKLVEFKAEIDFLVYKTFENHIEF